MTPFIKHAGTVAVLWRGNVDTDQIIPKDFLKSIKRTGFGPALFSDWRYLKDGSDNPDFALNQKEFRGASILLAGNNFGCGSSREHAVWALAQYGFKVIIAPNFADIFKNNSLKNGLLTIELPEADAEELHQAVLKNPQSMMTVDLSAQTIVFSNITKKFTINAGHKNKLLSGLDDIGLTLQHETAILAHESHLKHLKQSVD